MEFKGKFWLLVVFMMVVAYFPLCLHLDSFPIQKWDESRLTVNAMDMADEWTGFVVRYDGKPDDWSTKPPLMIWCQALGIKIFGIGELAMRLPSAIAGLLTCLLVFLASLKYLKSYVWAFATVLALITSQGYVSLHGTRTGDFDPLLTLFITGYLFCWFQYLDSGLKRKWILFFGAFVVCAVYTKGIAGLMMLPGVFLFTLLSRKVLIVMKQPMFWVSVLGVVAMTVLYYYVRNIQQPGYWAAIMENELWGRFGHSLEGHAEPFEYYLKNFIVFRYVFWYAVCLGGIVLSMVFEKGVQKRWLLFLLINAVLYLLIISKGATKLEWYDLPLYPLMAFFVAYPVELIWREVRKRCAMAEMRGISYYLLAGVTLALVFGQPYWTMVKAATTWRAAPWENATYDNGTVLRMITAKQIPCKKVYIAELGYEPQTLMYVRLFNDAGGSASFLDYKLMKPGDTVLTQKAEVKEYIDAHFTAIPVHIEQSAILYAITGYLPDTSAVKH